MSGHSGVTTERGIREDHLDIDLRLEQEEHFSV